MCVWITLRRRGFPEKLMATIRVTYDSAKCVHSIKISRGQIGVRQVCILSPKLFLLVVGDIFLAALLGGRRGLLWTMTSFFKHLY